MKQPYSIGLDIGTNSVGWAVINEDFSLCKYKHQNMWGANLFDKADDAATRRSFRSSRRRLARRKRRITLLQQIFDDEIQKVDPHFYLRLSESMLHLGDKNSALELDANILFADHSFTDKSYREKYPTIYHLRSSLFHDSEKQDIRLVYLALHHIIKYRGNFLVEGGVDSVISSFNSQNLQTFMDFIGADESIAKKVKAILLDRSLSRSVRKSDIIKLLQPTPDNKKIVSEAVGAVIGLKWNANKLFEDDSLEAKGEFSNKNYEEQRDEIAAAIGDDRYELVETLESVYQWTIFSQFIRKDSCLSDIMVEKYDDYRQDLSDLKSLFHEFLPKESYKSFFHGDAAEFEQYNKHKYSLEDLYKSIKNHLGNVAKEDPRYQRFEKRAELGEFLARQRIRDNGAIPHQIHQYELEKIIDNQAQYYPFLAQNRDKIISIFTFKLPYYIGPLKTGGNFAWSVKKKDGVIYPWNFDEMIDDEASAEKFIDRMRNNCTYLPDEEVLPKNSLLYQEYEVRNELKNVTVNGERLSPDIQNRIVDELFAKESSVTYKKLVKYLYDNQIYNTDSLIISGTAKEKSFASSRKSYLDFTNKIGIEITPKTQKAIEEVIKWITLFEDKKILAKKLQKHSDIFNENQLRTILKLNYSGWGRLSRKLLDGITAHTPYGELTVIETMRSSKDNFMQIIQSDRYEFKKIIDDILSADQRTDIAYDDIKKLAGSPGIKRALWRSVRIIDEIVDTIGY
ncbi:MAG: type II CRISPR RNA-guided endonuclease Cas9, partial [Candidatus Saccharimonas sp.]